MVNLEDTENDEAIARAIQRQIELEEQAAASASASVSAAASVSSVSALYPSPAPASDPTSDSTPDPGGIGRDPSDILLDSNPSDVEYALRIDQELRDEELALELQKMEQLQLNESDVPILMGAETTEQTTQKSKCPRGRIMSCIIFTPLVMLALLAIFILTIEQYRPGGTPWSNSLPEIDFFVPDKSSNEEVYPWKTNTRGLGLKLEIVNALTEEWHPFFDEAVKNWDNGRPDALALTTTSSDPDSDCTPLGGKMKVCNGNYGSTDWKGINELVYRNGYIISSTAKMNDYYMEYSGAGERQYLMCHEIGHGFGLPHTDENFYNRDLGNCMDYTNRPEDNQTPDTPNYDLLYQMYGSVHGHSRRNMRLSEDVSSFDELGLDSRRLSFLNSDVEQWKLLHRNRHRDVYESDLGNGYRVRAHIVKC